VRKAQQVLAFLARLARELERFDSGDAVLSQVPLQLLDHARHDISILEDVVYRRIVESSNVNQSAGGVEYLLSGACHLQPMY